MRLKGLAAAALVLALTSCAANPGPPPLVKQEELDELTATSTTTPKPRAARTEIQVGAEPLRGGLNPHLSADDTELVQSIARLTLPSAFIDGARDPNVISGATVLPSSPRAMTVRYIIADEAQWSDGTPLTGKDFEYLWRGMTSTPGALAPAAYQAVASVRVSGPGGKTVDVDFSEPVDTWREMFTNLLPAHLLSADASDFASALRETLPASAGKFMLVGVDRGRGTITLNRNDRYWGSDPARVDILTVNAVRGTTQVADQIRANQLGFVDKFPEETTKEVFDLIPDAQVRMVDGPRTLGVTLSATSPVLGEVAARHELRSLIDVPLLARVAGGRSTELAVAGHDPVSEAAPAVLPGLVSEDRPLRIASDPADQQASAAARSLADLLTRRGVPVRVVSTDTTTLLGSDLPRGEVDAVVHWDAGMDTASAQASRVLCPPEDYRAGNLSGLCSDETEALGAAILAGRVSGGEARAAVNAVEANAAVWVPVMYERRIVALGPSVSGPDPDLEKWSEGLSSAASWRLGEAATEPSTG